MPTSSSAWMPREQWDALVRGEACPLCQELESPFQVNAYGITIADLPMSRLRLASNQFVPGYCVLICTQHVQEPYHLSRSACLQFFADMTLTAQALEQVFQPIKMNFQLLGNAVPHLHAHIVPRYYGDPAPGRPIDPGIGTLELTAEARDMRVQAIRAALTMFATAEV